ncbi:MAG TPA: dihydrolipoyl dehydrogenase [Acidimicrobiales bacterium]
MSDDAYDMVILGGGTGGYSCALRAVDIGMRVALVERDKVGGTCLHRGCIPAKALLQVAEVASFAADASCYGVRASFDGVDAPAALGYKQGIVDTNHRGLQSTLRARGVEVVAGTGRLAEDRTIVVDTADGQRRLRGTRAAVLATGSTPRPLPVPGADIDGQLIITSDHALGLERVPDHPIVIGASAVGLEFATIWHAFGASTVTLIEALPQVAPREDEDTSKALAKELRRQGMQLITGATVTAVDRGEGAVRVVLGDDKTVEGDLLLVAVGRRPVSERMGFAKAGVRLDRGYITVDDHCRTGVDGIYALGDVIPRLGLAHSSFAEGFLVAEDVAGRHPLPLDYAGIPRVTYCHPEIAAVGFTEAQLRERNVAYDARTYPFSHNARAMMTNPAGHVKVLAGRDGGPVLGIHIIGPKATDLIAEAQLIYNWEALPRDVAQFIHPHPTVVEAIGEAHMALAGRRFHG